MKWVYRNARAYRRVMVSIGFKVSLQESVSDVFHNAMSYSKVTPVVTRRRLRKVLSVCARRMLENKTSRTDYRG